MTLGKVYLLPMLLHEEGFESMPSDVLTWIQQCDAFFVENEKTARRYFKKLWKEMVIDDYTWHAIHKVENEQIHAFSQLLKQGKNIGILSEAGCAGIADPGQILVAAAQELGAIVKPYTGPSSLLLALMGSGMNGQNFHFHGYLHIDALERKKKIQALETEIKQTGVTQLFIETPYRNNQLFEAITQSCHPNTKLCVAMELTGPNEWIKTQSVANWKNSKPELHKKLVVFLLGA
jgi:16S rRNA (cytidine1402-2'-O)-methyltransferase